MAQYILELQNLSPLTTKAAHQNIILNQERDTWENKMKQDRKSHIDTLRRKKQKILILSDWLEHFNLATASSCSITDFISVENTTNLKLLFYERIKNDLAVTNNNWPLNDSDALFEHIASMTSSPFPENIVLFNNVDDIIGALCVQAQTVLINAKSVWEIVGEDLRIASKDMKNGLCLGKEYYSIDGEYISSGVYQLTGWGIF